VVSEFDDETETTTEEDFDVSKLEELILGLEVDNRRDTFVDDTAMVELELPERDTDVDEDTKVTILAPQMPLFVLGPPIEDLR
jgi:hypothetical protein